MKLVWNKAMAHYQQEMSLLEDSLLYQAIAYYRQQSTDIARLLDTYLLEGMYLKWKEANDEAITVFDKGIALAISRKDTTNMLVLQRKKLEVLYKQSRFLECKAMIEDMLRIAHKLPVKEHYQMVYSLALVSQLGGDTSNIDCPEKGFQLALEAGDTCRPSYSAKPWRYAGRSTQIQGSHRPVPKAYPSQPRFPAVCCPVKSGRNLYKLRKE